MKLTQEDAKELAVLLNVIQDLRGLDPEISSITIAAFLFVAIRQGKIAQSDIAEFLGVSQATISRILKGLALGKDNTKLPGLNLVHVSVDNEDYRRRVPTLTPKGYSVAVKLSSILKR